MLARATVNTALFRARTGSGAKATPALFSKGWFSRNLGYLGALRVNSAHSRQTQPRAAPPPSWKTLLQPRRLQKHCSAYSEGRELSGKDPVLSSTGDTTEVDLGRPKKKHRPESRRGVPEVAEVRERFDEGLFGWR